MLHVVPAGILSFPSGGYVPAGGLYFDGSADYLNRTPSSAGNLLTWTFSCWVKRSSVGVEQNIFGGLPSNKGYVKFDSSDRLDVMNESSDGARNNQRITNQVFRDPTAWLHLVVQNDTTQSTAGNRMKIYLNGSQITDFYGTANLNEDEAGLVNTANAHYFGRNTSSQYLNAYLTEAIFIDGTAHTPSDFGEYNSDTGIWVPVDPSGLTFGDNGFHLDFADSSDLGNDVSGNNNDFTENSITAANSVTDNCVNDADNNKGNYLTLNPLTKNSGGSTATDITEGNTRWSRPNNGSNNQQCYGTFSATSGKFYFEFKLIAASNGFDVGLFAEGETNGNEGAGNAGYEVEGYYLENYGTGSHAWKVTKTGQATGGAARQDTNDTAQADDVCKIAVDFDAGKIWLGSVTHNTYYSGSDGSDVAFNTSAPTFTFTAGTRLFPYIFAHAQLNTCQFFFRPGGWTGSAPADFKPWNTASLTAPTVTDPSTVFQTKLYTGNGSTNALTFDGNSDMQPDFVWIKDRDETDSSALFDSVRGVQKYLQSNTDSDEQTSSDGITSFNSDGFTIGGNLNPINSSGDDFVAWCWKAGGAASTISGGMTKTSDSSTSNISRSVNTTSKFSIITYTGNGSASTIQHGLGVTPEWYFVKKRNNSGAWKVWHKDLHAEDKGYLVLNNEAEMAAFSDMRVWGSSPTSSVLGVGTHLFTNNNNDTFVLYAWAGVEGYSKFGIYEGNNSSSDGPFIPLGFKPALFICKNMDSGDVSASATNWLIFDSARNPSNDTSSNFLYANLTNSEATLNIDLLANGVKIVGTNSIDINSAHTFIYAAFAESPFALNNRAR